MYWYYKVFFGLILIIIIGVIARPFLKKVNFIDFFKNDEKIEGVKSEGDAETKALPKVLAKSLMQDKLLEEQINSIHRLFAAEKYTDVLEKGYLLLEDPLLEIFSKDWYKIADVIGKTNTVIAFSDIPYDSKEKYIVKSGDSLAKIVKRKTTVKAIAIANNISNNIIYPDQRLSFFAGPWHLETYKNKFVLIVYHKNKFFKYYKVGTGLHDRTPLGEFIIYDKIINPPYWNKGRQIPFGDPLNPLGTRWMAIRDTKQPELKGYGIHGTGESNSIGTESSQGCLRMLNKEVEELFNLLPYFTTLSIKE